MSSLHHIHLRKRGIQATHPYPARDWRVRLLDRLVFVAGVVGPVMTLPQLNNIYVLHEADGVSALSWGAFALLDLVWLGYGCVHRDRAITTTYTLWFFVNGAVAVGAIIYGGQ